MFYLHNPSFDSPETRTDWDDRIAAEILEREEALIREHEEDGYTITTEFRNYAAAKARQYVEERYAPDFG